MIVLLLKHDHEDQNERNFGELVRLMAVLNKDLETLTFKRNSTYFSKTSQNEVLSTRVTFNKTKISRWHQKP